MVTVYIGCLQLALSMSILNWVLVASVVGGHMIGWVLGIGGTFEVFGWLVEGWEWVYAGQLVLWYLLLEGRHWNHSERFFVLG